MSVLPPDEPPRRMKLPTASPFVLSTVLAIGIGLVVAAMAHQHDGKDSLVLAGLIFAVFAIVFYFLVQFVSDQNQPSVTARTLYVGKRAISTTLLTTSGVILGLSQFNRVEATDTLKAATIGLATAIAAALIHLNVLTGMPETAGKGESNLRLASMERFLIQVTYLSFSFGLIALVMDFVHRKGAIT